MPGKASMEIAGVKELQRAFMDVPVQLRKTVYRQAMTAGAKIARDAAKNNAKAFKDSGTLSKSIGYTISKSRTNAKIGARRGFKRPAPAHRRTEKQPFIDPFNYAHLVELGTRARITKTGITRGSMKATPFLQPAVDQNSGRIMGAISSTIRTRLPAAIAKAAAKTKARK